MTDLLLLASSISMAASSATSAAVSASATSVPGTGTLESIVTSVVPSIIASVLPSGATTTAPVTAQPIFLPVYFEVAATFAGALSGAMVAVSRRFDGLGGGIMRDVLLQNHGIFALNNPRALVAVLAASVVGAYFFSAAEKIRPLLGAVDALSLGLFALVGADKALVAGLSPLAAIMLGTITAIGGGIIRDLLCGREPAVLRRGSLFAVAAVVGSSIFVTMIEWLHFAKPVAMVVSATVAIALRLGSLWLGWESPEPRDLTHHVTGVPLRLWEVGGRVVRRTFRSRDRGPR
jgi:uncharacterized membrane protein YeiH